MAHGIIVLRLTRKVFPICKIVKWNNNFLFNQIYKRLGLWIRAIIISSRLLVSLFAFSFASVNPPFFFHRYQAQLVLYCKRRWKWQTTHAQSRQNIANTFFDPAVQILNEIVLLLYGLTTWASNFEAMEGLWPLISRRIQSDWSVWQHYWESIFYPAQLCFKCLKTKMISLRYSSWILWRSCSWKNIIWHRTILISWWRRSKMLWNTVVVATQINGVPPDGHTTLQCILHGVLSRLWVRRSSLFSGHSYIQILSLIPHLFEIINEFVTVRNLAIVKSVNINSSHTFIVFVWWKYLWAVKFLQNGGIPILFGEEKFNVSVQFKGSMIQVLAVRAIGNSKLNVKDLRNRYSSAYVL